MTDDCSDNLVEGDGDVRSSYAGRACCAGGSGGSGAGTYCSARWCNARRRTAASGSIDGNISACEVDLARLEGVPAQGQQGMRRVVVGNLDLLRDSITTSNGRVARVQRRVVDTLALRLVTGAETVAGEPVIAVACLTGRAVGVVPAGLAADIGAV